MGDGQEAIDEPDLDLPITHHGSLITLFSPLTALFRVGKLAATFEPHSPGNVSKKPKSEAVAAPDLEKSLGELEKIVSRLETGELTLDESLKQFERGVELTRQCQTALANAEQKVEVLLRKSGQQYVAEPFDDEAASDADDNESP